MLNYMRSEWYRVTHCATIYIFTAVMAGLTLLLNVILFVMGKTEPNFPYGTVSFSLSCLASGMTLMFMVGAVVVSLLYSGDKKNGLLKNAVAFGIAREKMFLARCIVCSGASLYSLAAILVVYIGSAVLLLPPGVEPDAAWILLRGVVYMLIMAIAFEVLTVALYDFFEKEVPAYIIWYLVMAMIPSWLNLLGMKVPLVKEMAAWMPMNYLAEEVMVDMSGWSCMWETPEGVAKCLISGVIGLVVFTLVGILLSKKREL